MKRLFFAFAGLVALGFTEMWIVGLFYYSAVVVDHNLHDPSGRPVTGSVTVHDF